MPNKRRTAKPKKQRALKPGRAAINRPEMLRQMLLSKKQELIRDMDKHLSHQINEDIQQRIADVLDSGDQATQDMAEDLGLSFLEIQNKNLKTVNEALNRLKEKTYGICKECNTEIPEKRLTAMPFANFCVNCQEKQETLEKIEKEEERFK